MVLAHGFAFTRDARLDAYAQRFVAAGFAALVFDYRHFGASQGQPRQLMTSVASSRIGGHVAALAASDRRVVVAVSQVPYSGLGGRGRLRPAFLARMTAAAVRDELRGRLGRTPAFLPLVAEPGSGVFAPFVEEGATAEIRELFPAGYAWENQFTPRVMLRLPRYRPFHSADQIACPWLVLVCDDDAVTPADQAAALASRAPRLELHRFLVGHFEIYRGEWFERAVAVQTEFLRRHLPLSRLASGRP
ncbi:alpha/beta fold hydrolase [soil metagenome]